MPDLPFSAGLAKSNAKLMQGTNSNPLVTNSFYNAHMYIQLASPVVWRIFR